MDPSWIAAGSQLLGALTKPPAAAPAISGAPVNIGQDIDFSGFTVGTGSARVTGAPNNKTTSPAAGGAGIGQPAGAGGGGLNVGLLVAAGAAALAFMTEK